jgi:hypothetical protein
MGTHNKCKTLTIDAPLGGAALKLRRTVVKFEDEKKVPKSASGKLVDAVPSVVSSI